MCGGGCPALAVAIVIRITAVVVQAGVMQLLEAEEGLKKKAMDTLMMGAESGKLDEARMG